MAGAIRTAITTRTNQVHEQARGRTNDVTSPLVRHPDQHADCLVLTNDRRLADDWDTLAADGHGWEQGYADSEFLGQWRRHRQVYGYTLRSEPVYQLDRVPRSGVIRRRRDGRRVDSVAQAVTAAKGISLVVWSSVSAESLAIDSSDR